MNSKDKSDQSTAPGKELTFEAALEKLKVLVADMESGKLELDKMIDSYGQGVKLVEQCEKHLRNAEDRIHELMEKNGQFTLNPLK